MGQNPSDENFVDGLSLEEDKQYAKEDVNYDVIMDFNTRSLSCRQL
jgi:hypothetical protein